MNDDVEMRIHYPNGHSEDVKSSSLNDALPVTPEKAKPVVMSDFVANFDNLKDLKGAWISTNQIKFAEPQPQNITIDIASFKGKITYTDSSGQMKYNEAAYASEMINYIRSTYGQHYVGKNNTQLFDLLFAGDSTEANGFLRFNAMKYLSRQGKKKGNERSDILKALHYTLLMLYVFDSQQDKE